LALVSLCALAAAVAPAARGQDGSDSPGGISVEENQQVFATLCALDAAGFQAEESTLGDSAAPIAFRQELLRLQGPATDAVRSYYNGHPGANPGTLLSRYITFALVLGPPPRFSFQINEDELPPEALALEDFQPLLGAFYQEAQLESRWQTMQPERVRLSGTYRALLRGVVVKTNAYLREIVGSRGGRTFTLYVEPLAGGRTNFRNLGDHYALVVGPNPNDSEDEVQHAYLHFMLDPMVIADLNKLEAKRPLLDIGGRAPELPDEFRNDLTSFVDECVVKAVELKLRNISAAQREAVLKQDDDAGFVMVRPLYAGLAKFEKDTPSMTYYLADLVAGVDVAAEQKRFEGYTFATAETAPAKTQPDGEAAAPSKAQLLAQGDREIALHNGEAAAAAFNQVLQAYPNDPEALYGLAVASVLSGHADESRELFQRVIATAGSSNSSAPTNPTVVAWSHIYLGRIADLEGTRDLAIKEYRAALAVAGAPDAARLAAQRGVDQAYAPPARGGGDNTQQP
jgi:hypothetical protein